MMCLNGLDLLRWIYRLRIICSKRFILNHWKLFAFIHNMPQKKMLKCYLVSHEIEPPKTQDMQVLLEMCIEIDNEPNNFFIFVYYLFTVVSLFIVADKQILTTLSI